MKLISILLLIPTLALAKVEFNKFELVDGKVAPFSLSNQPLKKVINAYAKFIGKPLLVEKKKLRGKVNLSIPGELGKKVFHELFISMLDTQGYALIENDAFIRVISARDIRYNAVDFFMSENYPKGDKYILVMHELKNPLGASIARNMRPFLSRYARVINLNDGHTIILQDRGNNIERLLEIITNMDNKIKLDEFIAMKKAKQLKKQKKVDKVDIEILKLEKKLLVKKVLELETAEGKR
jgi:general secretion pathway protein D